MQLLALAMSSWLHRPGLGSGRLGRCRSRSAAAPPAQTPPACAGDPAALTIDSMAIEREERQGSMQGRAQHVCRASRAQCTRTQHHRMAGARRVQSPMQSQSTTEACKARGVRKAWMSCRAQRTWRVDCGPRSWRRRLSRSRGARVGSTSHASGTSMLSVRMRAAGSPLNAAAGSPGSASSPPSPAQAHTEAWQSAVRSEARCCKRTRRLKIVQRPAAFVSECRS